jgi:lipopolysaccharide export system protein LptA
MKIILIIIAAFLVSASLVLAAPATKVNHKDRSNLPISIKSNALSADNKGKLAIFTGKVIAKQGDISIYADKLSIYYGEKNNEVDKIEADGSVRIVQENRTGIADHAVYDNREGRITLTGNPKVMQGSDTLSGETITYFIDEDRSVVTGGVNKRVEAVIQQPARKGNAAPR